MVYCDRYSVGVIITNRSWDQPAPLSVDYRNVKHLLIRRSDGLGCAPIAGHAETGDLIHHMRAETWEEGGLTVTSHAKPLTPAQGLWLPNRCSKGVAPGKTAGHEWHLWAPTVKGDFAPCPDETDGGDFFAWGQVISMADLAIKHVLARTPAGKWASEDFLEVPWVLLYDHLGWLNLTKVQRDALIAYSALPHDQR